VRKKTEADITESPHDDKPSPHLCTVCHKRFTTKQSLTIHSKRHDGENLQYQCTYCEKRFANQQHLQRHMNVHSSKYKCTECGKCFCNKTSLAVHRRIHSGEKPFECTVCSKRFTASQSHFPNFFSKVTNEVLLKFRVT